MPWLKSTEPFLKVHKVKLPNGAKYICDFTWKFDTGPKYVFSYLDGSENAGRIKERKIIANDTELCFAIHPCALFLESYYLGYLHRAS